MDSKAFANAWSGSPIIKYQLKHRLADGINESIAEQLKNGGLPQSAEPWLHFMEFLIFDDTTGDMERMGLYPIGYLENGDIICIEKSSGRIVISDHEEPSFIWSLNSSLACLRESMVIFYNFMKEVNEKNPNFSKNLKIPDGMLDALSEKLKKADEAAYNDEGYWFMEIYSLSD